MKVFFIEYAFETRWSGLHFREVEHSDAAGQRVQRHRIKDALDRGRVIDAVRRVTVSLLVMVTSGSDKAIGRCQETYHARHIAAIIGTCIH